MAHIEALPLVLHTQFSDLIAEIQALGLRIAQLDKSLTTIAREDSIAPLLMSVPGIGVTTATALIAGVPDIHLFKRARQFSAWLGVTPKEHSSGNKRRLGAISKQGDTYLRTLMVHCARSALQQAHRQDAKDPDKLSNLQRWVLQLEGSRPRNVATVALANKMARLVWATWTQSRAYKP